MKNTIRIAFILALSLLLFSACSQSLKDELVEYCNNTMKPFDAKLEECAVKYNAAHADFSSNRISADDFVKVLDEIIPVSQELVKTAKGIKLDIAEVKELNDIKTKLCEKRLEGYTLARQMLMSRDFDKDPELKKVMTESDNLIKSFNTKLRKLAQDNGISVVTETK